MRRTISLTLLAALALLALVWALPGPRLSASAQVQPTRTPNPRAATPLELEKAYQEWENSAHADTYDDGLGANTTCASCKSPKNWDPASDAMDAAHDCGACKRIPGAPRPDLLGGVPVAQSEWRNIGCEICHQPAGDSFRVEISYWNQARGVYEPVESVSALCDRCHSGTHGFHVITEQAVSPAHNGWECTACHGAHAQPSACTDCHDPTRGPGAFEHARHPSVNCTACHDNGNLSLWYDAYPEGRHYGTYMPRRFAHTLTSWPSHNLSAEVRCVRCHHPDYDGTGVLVDEIGCQACHAEGAGYFWCENFPQDPDPNPTPQP
jgi:hypothetical protein